MEFGRPAQQPRGSLVELAIAARFGGGPKTCSHCHRLNNAGDLLGLCFREIEWQALNVDC
jgi:hypothetical protein